jgi:hypothetical protein
VLPCNETIAGGFANFSAFHITNSDLGTAAVFDTTNAASVADTVDIHGNSLGPALFVQTTNASAACGNFFTNNAGNAAPVLSAGSNGTGILVQATRTTSGLCADFHNFGSASASHVMDVQTDGAGIGLYASHNSGTGLAPTIEGDTFSFTGGTVDNAPSGVLGVAAAAGNVSFNAGVRGLNRNTGAFGVGVVAYHAGTGYGLWSETADRANGIAGQFEGNVNVDGNLSIVNAARSIVFGATTGTNAPMIEMFSSGTGNSPRMVIAHSAAFPTWGLEYDDAPDKFYFIGNNLNAMTVDLTNLRVGVKTASPTFDLEVNGTAGKPGGGSWSVSSDARLKEGIAPLEGSLDRLLSLRGVSFRYKDPDSIHELHGTQIGMVAQDVEKVFPQWVDEGPGGYKRLTVRGFEALTVEALRDLKTRQDEQIRALKTENDELRSRLEAIEAVVAAIQPAAR